MKKAIVISMLLVLGACGQQGVVETGATGATGAQGPQGNTGATGPAGANGTAITVVQLCPGTPVYPSAFIETALCINNQLYGVYSANDGFLTLLPPGAYTSDGIGASCNLTIQPNCVVTN